MAGAVCVISGTIYAEAIHLSALNETEDHKVIASILHQSSVRMAIFAIVSLGIYWGVLSYFGQRRGFIPRNDWGWTMAALVLFYMRLLFIIPAIRQWDINPHFPDANGKIWQLWQYSVAISA